MNADAQHRLRENLNTSTFQVRFEHLFISGNSRLGGAEISCCHELKTVINPEKEPR
jgi:hypothetical protein